MPANSRGEKIRGMGDGEGTREKRANKDEEGVKDGEGKRTGCGRRGTRRTDLLIGHLIDRLIIAHSLL